MNKKSKKNHIDSILRVDHAGETAAAKIYDGQLAVLKKHPCWPNNSAYERPRTRTSRYIQ